MNKFTEFFTEEGEPTNSVSNGGIDAPESKLGDTVKKRGKKRLDKMNRRKGTKGFKEYMSESKLYRGYDPKYDILGLQEIVWFSYDPELAKLYSYQSGKVGENDAKLSIGYIDYTPLNSYDAGWDNRVLKPYELLDDMIAQSSLEHVGKGMESWMEKFLTAYGDTEQSIIAYWNGDDDYFALILGSLGFDSVKIKEKHTRTVGILRKYIEKKKGTPVVEARKVLKLIKGLHLTAGEKKNIKNILDAPIYADNKDKILYTVGRKKYRIKEVGETFEIEIIENETDMFKNMQKIKRQYTVTYG